MSPRGGRLLPHCRQDVRMGRKPLLQTGDVGKEEAEIDVAGRWFLDQRDGRGLRATHMLSARGGGVESYRLSAKMRVSRAVPGPSLGARGAVVLWPGSWKDSSCRWWARGPQPCSQESALLWAGSPSAQLIRPRGVSAQGRSGPGLLHSQCGSFPLTSDRGVWKGPSEDPPLKESAQQSKKKKKRRRRRRRTIASLALLCNLAFFSA